MTREQIYNLWAPLDSPWSLWAKPVLFAQLSPMPSGEPAGFENSLPLPVAPNEAIVVDLPGRLSVITAISLARAGRRPVPLFNAVPGLPNPTVDVRGIATAIIDASPHLAAVKLPATAAPAFLLDHDRNRGFPQPGDFDNRSISLPTDFPSARVLREHSIGRVLVVQEKVTAPQSDLSHTLRRWQDAGIAVSLYGTANQEGPRPWEIHRPSMYKALLHNFFVLFGLRRNPLGGFGGLLPIPGAG